MAKLHTLTEDFNSTLDTEKWTIEWPSGGDVYTDGGRLVVDAEDGATGLISVDAYDFLGSHAFVDIQPTIADGTGFAFSLIFNEGEADEDQIFFQVAVGDTGEELVGYLYYVSGRGFSEELDPEGDYSGLPIGSMFEAAGYDPVDHRWLRFREDGGTIYWEASPDGSSWDVLGSVTHTLSAANAKVVLNGGLMWPKFTADNVNITPTPKFSTLVEDFATGIDSKWEPDGEVIAWVDGKVVVSNGVLDGISTTSYYDLHESSVSLQLSNVEGLVLIQLSGVTTDVVPAFVLATDEGELTIGAGDFAEILTTDPAEPTLSERREWFRFRETGGTLHWETSADGRTWDVLGTAEHSENFSRLRLSVGVLFGGSFTFDNVNITPPPAEWGKFFAFF